MPSELSKAFVLVIVTVSLTAFVYYLGLTGLLPITALRPSYTLIGALFGISIYFFLLSFTPRVREERLRFMFNKISAVLSAAVSLIVILAIWIQEVTVLAFSLGLVAAGVSFSLKEPITSLVGWLVMAFERPFTVGDRISMDGAEGDVVDYGFFFIRIMEIGQWTNTNLYTGRILLVPTNWILTRAVYNYSKDFEFIWDRIWIGLLYGSDFKKVADEIQEITKRHTEEMVVRASEEYGKLMKRSYVPEQSMEPSVFFSFDSNWIELNLRYIVDVRSRSKIKSELSQMILSYLRDNSVGVASSSMNISMVGQDKPGSSSA